MNNNNVKSYKNNIKIDEKNIIQGIQNHKIFVG